jgi:hypothetical protein
VQKNDKGELIVRYISAIDDNYLDAGGVKNHYLKNALNALLAGKKPDPGYTKAIGCGIISKMAMR